MKTNMKIKFTRLALLTFAVFAFAIGPVQADNHKAKKTIVDIAVSNPDFSTLVTALKKADLVSTLSAKGPFTVFAPTNEAFAKVPKAKLDALLADKAALTKVLTYHVVSGKVDSKAVVKLSEAKTVQGQKLKVKVSDQAVMVNNAKVIKVDIMGSNGVIHVIDSVLLPK